MSGKMFWQIVLLIIIAGVVASALKIGMVCYKYGWCKDKYLQNRPQKSWQK